MNKVFIATSLDGYIADKEGKIDWLHSIPNPEGNNMGYSNFMSTVDALLMGRTTFETVLGFGIPWPYDKPVFVLSTTLSSVPKELNDKVFVVSGELRNILQEINSKGYKNLYIDGGKTIQGFLSEELIEEMTITIIPALLGGGTKLFGDLKIAQSFKCIETKIFLEQVVQNRFVKTTP